jgi:hypothetical protein
LEGKPLFGDEERELLRRMREEPELDAITGMAERVMPVGRDDPMPNVDLTIARYLLAALERDEEGMAQGTRGSEETISRIMREHDDARAEANWHRRRVAAQDERCEELAKLYEHLGGDPERLLPKRP